MSNPIRYDMNGPRRLYGEGYGTGASRMPSPPGDPALRDRIATLAMQAPTDPQTGADGTQATDQPPTTPASPAALQGRAPASLSSFLASGGQTPTQAAASGAPSTNQYTLGEVGNATIDRTPKTPFLQTGLGRAIRAGLGSLAMNLSPSAHGTAGWLGSLANGFTDAANLSDAHTAAAAQQQQAAQRQSFVDLLTKSQIGRNEADAHKAMAPGNTPRPLVIPGVGVEDFNPDGSFKGFETDPDSGKRIIPPIAGVAAANARATQPGQSPADKFYTQQYAKFKGTLDPDTRQPMYDNATAAGMAAEATQTRFPGYHVMGYRPPHAQPNNPNASPAAVRTRLTNAGVAPDMVTKVAAQRAQAQRPTVQGKIQITQDDWNRLRQDGMGAADIQDQYAVPAGVGDQ